MPCCRAFYTVERSNNDDDSVPSVWNFNELSQSVEYCKKEICEDRESCVYLSMDISAFVSLLRIVSMKFVMYFFWKGCTVK